MRTLHSRRNHLNLLKFLSNINDRKLYKGSDMNFCNLTLNI